MVNRYYRDLIHFSLPPSSVPVTRLSPTPSVLLLPLLLLLLFFLGAKVSSLDRKLRLDANSRRDRDPRGTLEKAEPSSIRLKRNIVACTRAAGQSLCRSSICYFARDTRERLRKSVDTFARNRFRKRTRATESNGGLRRTEKYFSPRCAR